MHEPLSALSLVPSPSPSSPALDYMAPEVLSCPLKRTPQENKDDPSAPGYGPEVRGSWGAGGKEGCQGEGPRLGWVVGTTGAPMPQSDGTTTQTGQLCICLELVERVAAGFASTVL